jgi:hypothetical protein
MSPRCSKTSKIRRALRINFPIRDGKPSLVEVIEDLNIPLETASRQAGYSFDDVCLFLTKNPGLGSLTEYRRYISRINIRNRKPRYH